MQVITSLEQLKANMDSIDYYLSGTYSERIFAKNLIKRGTCFVARACGTGYSFYPSRFIGYQNNTLSAHTNNSDKDGRITNPAISSVLKSCPLPDAAMEREYQRYCLSLGIEAGAKGSFGVTRKYWIL